MLCRALTPDKRRCANAAMEGSFYCREHRAAMEQLLSPTRAPSGRLGALWSKLASDGANIPDGGRYDVPGWLKHAPTPEVMRHLRTHDDSMVRWMAAFMLRKRRAAEALDALWETLQLDPVRLVRQQAAVALGKIGTPAVYVPLVEALHHDHDPGVREACVIALGNLGNPAAVDEIVRVLGREENVFVKWDCIVALGALGDHRVEKLLTRLQAEEIAQVVRDACRDSLAEIRRRTRAAM